MCRAHRYPPATAETAGNSRGIGAHTDFGALTLLMQDQSKPAFELCRIQLGIMTTHDTQLAVSKYTTSPAARGILWCLSTMHLLST